MESRIGHHHEPPTQLNLLLKNLLSKESLLLNRALVNKLLHFHGMFQHFISHLFGNEPAGSIMCIVFDLSCANLWWHHLQAISDRDVLALKVLSIPIFIQTSQAFWLERTLACQIFDGDGGPVDFESQIVY